MRQRNDTSKTFGLRTLLLMLASFLLVVPAEAAELLNNWLNTRALGMGNAYTSVVSDSDALFYNPAGLANISGINWTIFDLHGGANGMDAIQNAQTVASAKDDIPGAMKKLYGKKIWAEGGGKSAVSMPGFAFGAFVNTETGFTASSAPNPDIEPNIVFDYGAAAGFAVSIIPGIAKVGIVAKRVTRTGTTKPLGAGSLAGLDPSTLEGEFKRRGTGYGLDVGAQIKLPGPVSPSLSVVSRDVGYTTFSHEEGIGAPPRIDPETVIGGSLELSIPFIRVTPAFDYRYFNRADVQLGKKINLGCEVSLPLIDLRAGLHQGYYTAGVGLNLALLRVDVATWGVELGEYPGQREDRRYMAQVTFEIGFDLFGFGGSGGSSSSGDGKDGSGSAPPKRHLKQRR